MNSTTVAVDLAKNVFEIAAAGADWRITERRQLSRAKFLRFFVQLPPCNVVMEACGSAHHWGRHIAALGHNVRLLPAHYVKKYVRRNKTDRADAAALIEAARCADMRAVPVKTIEQQQVLSLHAVREQWKRGRQRYINVLRGTLREFGVFIPVGIEVGAKRIGAEIANTSNELPDALRPALTEMLDELRVLEDRMKRVERTITTLSRNDDRVAKLRDLPGIGLLTSTALKATVGDIRRFPSGRHLASWLGITASERSSAERRRLGKISKQGDTYLRTLLIHGARSAMQAAHRAQKSGRPLDRLQRWALDCEQRRGKNKAAVALANRMARIVWATWTYDRPFNPNWANQAA